MRKSSLFMLLVTVMSIILLTSCGKSEAVKAAEAAIAAIGSVSADSGEAIANADKCMSILTDSEKEKVSNRLDLVAAKDTYKIKCVEKLIDDIGEIDFSSEEKIVEAENAYLELNPEEQEKVSNKAELENARIAFENLELPKEDKIAFFAMYRADEYFQTYLKNPSSLQFNSITSGYYADDDVYIFEFDYNAENSFGGSVRDQFYIAVNNSADSYSCKLYGDSYLEGSQNQKYTSMFFLGATDIVMYDPNYLLEHMYDIWE